MTGRSNGQASISRFVEIALYAPVGVLAYFRDMGPTFLNVLISRGRRELDHAHAQARARASSVSDQIRTVGDSAIARGTPVVDRLKDSTGRASSDVDHEVDLTTADLTTADLTDEEPAVADHDHVTEHVTEAPAPETAPDAPADDLAIPGYDSLSASQVVDRLGGLDTLQLEAVREYETGHRQRRTILGKIEQLAT